MRKDPLNLDTPTPSARPFDASKTLTLGAQQAICEAQELARASGSERVESVHLLLGALQLEPPDAKLGALLQVSGLKADEVQLYAQAACGHLSELPQEFHQLSKSARHTIQIAGKEARRTNSALVDVSHLFVACFHSQTSPELAEVLKPLGVSARQLSVHLRGLSRVQAQNESPLAQLTAQSERVLNAAHAAMRAQFCGRISTLHLLIGILENPDNDAVAALQTLMIDVSEIKQRAAVATTSDGQIAGPNRLFTPAAKRALDRAKAHARERGHKFIGPEDLLIGLLPAPLLLIERTQFGANPDDPAAAPLRDVDADLLRAIFNPPTVATAPALSAVAPVVKSRKKISGMPFWLPFSAQVLIGASLQNTIKGSSQARILAAAILLLIVLGGLGAALAQLHFKGARFKTPSLLFFAGALLGAMAAMYLAR